ncbi:MAG: ParA family protein [Pseudomonadota bacterium]
MGDGPPIVAVANLKGGVGKSTTALMLAEGLAYRYGLNILLADFDAQANLSETLLTSDGVQRELNQGRGVAAVLDHFLPLSEQKNLSLKDVVETRNSTVVEELVSKHERDKPGGWISLLPAHPGMRFLEPHLERSPGEGWFEIGDDLAERFLDATALARSRADLVIIDCPPHVSALCRAALKLAHYYVTPTLAEALSVWGVHQFLRWLAHPSMSGWLGVTPSSIPTRQFVVCTRFSARSRSHKRTLDTLRDDWHGRAFSDPVRQRLSLSRDLERRELDSTHGFGGRYRGQVKSDVLALADAFTGFITARAGVSWARPGY